MPVTINGTTGIAGPDGSASTPAVQGTDSNTGLFYPAADTVALSTGGSERMRITSAGNVGIGTSAPAKPFNLVTSGTTEAWIESTSTQKAILSLAADDNAVGLTSTYNSGGTAARPFIFYNVSTSLLQFDLGKTVALQGATSKTGTGITFPATQSASSDANTLDDYEEGTWTPNVGGTATYTTQTASYTKIGNTVVVWGEITINLIGTGSTTRVYGLPFTSNGSYVQPGSTGYFANLAQSVYSMTTAVEPGTTNLVFHTQTSLSGTNNINQAVLGNSARIQFSVTYKV